MPDDTCITRRKLLYSMPPAGLALLAASPTAPSYTSDPVIGLLRQHYLSLENETDDWKAIERNIASGPPKIVSREGALECLRTALRIDNMGSFETALVSSALEYFER